MEITLTELHVAATYERLFLDASGDCHTEGALWYPHNHRWAHNLANNHGMEPERVCAVAAVLSPMLTWGKAKTLTADALDWHRHGYSLDNLPCYRTTATKVRALLECPWPPTGTELPSPLTAPKTYNFYRTLVDPKWPTAVIDRHMVKPFGVREASARAYDLFAEGCKEGAHHQGVLVSEFQATIWLHVRSGDWVRVPETA
jgi:hypothetical protein